MPCIYFFTGKTRSGMAFCNACVIFGGSCRAQHVGTQRAVTQIRSRPVTAYSRCVRTYYPYIMKHRCSLDIGIIKVKIHPVCDCQSLIGHGTAVYKQNPADLAACGIYAVYEFTVIESIAVHSTIVFQP